MPAKLSSDCARYGALLALTLLLPASARAFEAHEVGRLGNLKVLSYKVDDVSSIDNILRSFSKPGMTDSQRAAALWRAVVKYRHQTPPANEFLARDSESHDPVKIFNVYGYCMCCCTSALIEALNRADGREVRGRILTGHSVPEVRYGDGWHMFDPALITLFPKPEGGEPASVDEIAAAVAAWYVQNPQYQGNDQALRQLMKSEGGQGWKTKGPALLAGSPFYKQGWFPAHTHGWYSTMQEYDRKCGLYDYGYQVGHRAVFSLRPGESLVREAGNRGLHVNMDSRPNWNYLKARAPEGDLVFLKEYFPGYRGGVVGNGVHRYAPDLTGGELQRGAEVFENLASGGAPALRVQEEGKPGTAVVELASPYVYLGGKLRVRGQRRSESDRVALSLSTNNGRSFEPLWQAGQVGPFEADVQIGKRILRRYAFWLKIEIVSSAPRGTGLDLLEVASDFQHAPRTLPWLGAGRNTITVDADRDSAIATRTVSCRITADPQFTNNETTGTMGVRFEGLDVRDGSCWWTQGEGKMTVPLETPGDIVALRWSAQVRAISPSEHVSMFWSADAGKTWREVGRIAGPTIGHTGTFRLDAIPPGVTRGLMELRFKGDTEVGLFSFRLDADYRDPLASSAPEPWRVVHRWREDGKEREHAQTITRLPATYTIEAGAEPELVFVTYEMPGAGRRAASR
jgi:hypothetical protein